MARKKHSVTLMMDDDLHTKLLLISYVQHYKHEDKHASFSRFVEQAVIEYMKNHADELQQLIDEVNNLWKENTNAPAETSGNH